MTPFPVLITERLTLRQLSLDDQDDILALRSNPDVNKYLDRTPARTVEDAVNFINKVNENIEIGNAFYWAIILTGRGKFVGTICLYNVSQENSSCEIGFELSPEFQGQGIMAEAAEKVIEYVFRTFREINAFTHSGNLNSIKLLRKLHFNLSEEADLENDGNLFKLINSPDKS